MPPDVTDLCTARAYPDAPFGGRPVLGCLDADGHGPWHYDPLDDITWRHGRHQDSPPPGGANREENPMQQPTIGRIVHVLMDPAANNGEDYAPAIITRVWNPAYINVRVIRDGHPDPSEWMTSISLHESRETLEASLKAHEERFGHPATSVRAAWWPPRDPQPQIISGDGETA